MGYDNVATANTLPNAPAFPQHMTRRTVWVVDDDPRLCQLLGHYLSGEGYQVYTAMCAASFLERVNDAPADLIILDLMLPDQDGFGVTQQLRTHSGVPILMLSGRAEVVVPDNPAALVRSVQMRHPCSSMAGSL
nr:response regulator [Gammaproteobacteria bacterium]